MLQNGWIILGYKVVVPTKLKKYILQQLHESHFGIVKMRNLAMLYLLRPNINNDIQNEAKSCQNCMVYNEMSPIEYVAVPWKAMRMAPHRFFGLLCYRYIFVIVDAFIKWVEAFFMNKITSQATINILRCTFFFSFT